MNYLSDEDYLAALTYEHRKAENRLNALDQDDVSPERTRRYARFLETKNALNEARALITKNAK